MRIRLAVFVVTFAVAGCGGSRAAAKPPTPAPTKLGGANHIGTAPVTTAPPIKGKGKKTSSATPVGTAALLPTTKPIAPPTPTPIPAKVYTALLKGSVTDSKSGSPIAGAIVRLGSGQIVRTSAFGNYQVRFPGGTMMTVTVTKQGYVGRLSVGRIAPHSTYTLDFRLDPIIPGKTPPPPLPSIFGTPGPASGPPPLSPPPGQ